MDQTSPYSNRRAGVVIAVPLTILLSVGTGEILTQEVCKQRESGKRFEYHSSPDNSVCTNLRDIITPAADIAYIRAALKTSVTDLANCIGVSRQSLYYWKTGANIKNQHLTKLAELKAAANTLLAENISVSPLVIGRKLPGGKTMFEAIADGTNGRAAAMSLIAMLRDEAAQQESLERRFAARLAAAPKNADYGAPGFDERG
jgi:hypothetical protein